MKRPPSSRPALQDREIVEREILACGSLPGKAPLETILGKNAPISASFGSILSLPMQALGHAHFEELDDARGDLVDGVDFQRDLHALRMLAKALISTGMFEPLGFSNSSAGPPVFTLRSANSVISRCGSTSNGMRFSSPFFSRARMKSRRSS